MYVCMYAHAHIHVRTFTHAHAMHVYMQEVVDWLEKNARSNLKYFPEKIHFFADDVMWENTFHRLQFARDTDRDHIITEMVTMVTSVIT